MSDARDLYRRWIYELWSGKPVAGEIVADNFVGHWPNREVHGPAELQSIIDETRTVFDELTFDIEVGPLVDGELVAARWSGRGTSGGTVTPFSGNDILRVADGRFVEYWTGTSAG
ncbi:polyketide cyclase [Mycobacterium heckeshornense]|uniref:Uncharacterized protein n=1 Tax=Mycobacterium heckeshornense TaxID=110505 RepID=A0A2G8BJ82_9MYCO|nr:nuclear transport factor 2 family protein [Mycobacterium heckeshornense]KMV24531.1 polyketide cyclase [Mycobacterium heckeshornense]MCV7035615.1 nuclear transport factor 2 family protein [Mycobacterium heckeshornense]PIJ37841.1 polyketide cyclase [Mycobacterium heckeshornense]BCO37788.1 hypothetical protein MHEC_42210 [Mycobacterium heckeshornense]